MTKDFERRSLTLTPQQWDALEKLAQEMLSFAPTGKAAGRSSWRTLIKDIANGDVMLSRKETNHASDTI